MAKTVQTAFQELKKNLEITGLQTSTTSTRQKNVRAAVEADFDVLRSFLTGSYAKSTMVAPLSEADLDIFVVLHADHFDRTGQSQLLADLRRTLRKKYPKTPKVSPNGQAVTISFTDFEVDVVPAFNRKGGGFLIPNANTNSWISTDPSSHIDHVIRANALHDGNMVPLIKMIKGWNRNIDDVFIGFYLELITIELLQGVTISDFPSGVRYIFDKGRDRILKKAPDPAGYGGHVNGLSKGSVEAAVRQFENAYSQAREAERYDLSGQPAAAIQRWRSIFGDYFPVYG